MKQKSSSFDRAMLFTMVGGAALGAIAVALTTPKTGKEIRNQLVALRDRYRGKAKVSDQTDDETVQMQFI